MKAPNQKHQAVTLVEICVGVFILSIVMTAVMSLFAGGMKGSKKGMAHLTNMQTAAIIMAQIEYDLLRATAIIDPAPETIESEARWEFGNEDGSVGTVTYNLLPDGLERHESNSLSGGKRHTFGKGLNMKLQFRHLEFAVPAEKKVKEGMLINIKIASDNSSNEEFNISRLIICRNVKRDIL